MMTLTLAYNDAEYKLTLEGWDSVNDVIDELMWLFGDDVKALP